MGYKGPILPLPSGIPHAPGIAEDPAAGKGDDADFTADEDGGAHGAAGSGGAPNALLAEIHKGKLLKPPKPIAAAPIYDPSDPGAEVKQEYIDWYNKLYANSTPSQRRYLDGFKFNHGESTNSMAMQKGIIRKAHAQMDSDEDEDDVWSD